MENIAEQNLALMLNNKRGGMNQLLMKESVGGNADEYDELPCAATNFYYDKDTGAIQIFTNKKIANKQWHRGIFRVLINSHILENNLPVVKIVEQFLDKSSSIVIQNIKDSVKLYNEYWKNYTNKERKKQQDKTLLQKLKNSVLNYFGH